VVLTSLLLAGTTETAVGGEITASSTAAGTAPGGAIDGDRFSVAAGSLWKGEANQGTWWWQIRFPQPRPVGAILQIHGDRPLSFRNAPRHYVWQHSEDGRNWQNWDETQVRRERRLFRLHRLAEVRDVQYVRLMIFESLDAAPALREVEFLAEPTATIEFPDWIAVVGTGEETSPPDAPGPFVNLARQCAGWEHSQFQQIPHGEFDEGFLASEPHLLCAFFTGSILDWCQVKREPWRGVQQVLQNRNLPIWGACGGAQILAILEETGVDRPWDCPRCRDPKNPKLPVYTHIGHTGEAPCGDYSKNIGERGKYEVRIIARDPVFEGLPELFETTEAHVGQIEYVPKGWVRMVTKGPKGLTENQCLRVADRFIYAAQFHMELPGTPEPSQRIMSNFLTAAKRWGGYNPQGKPLAPPEACGP
jgi:hypothetical protein